MTPLGVRDLKKDQGVRRAVLSALKAVLALLVGLTIGFLAGSTGLGDFFPRSLFLAAVLAVVVAVLAYLRPSVHRSVTFFFERFGNLNIFTFVSAFSLAVSTSSVIRKPQGLNLWDRVGGFIPFSDAQNYLSQVLAEETGSFDEFNARRPLNTSLRILQYDIAGSTLLGVQMVQVTFAALSAALLATAISRYVGELAALGSLLLSAYWIWPYASSFLTEINGFTFAAAGLATIFLGLEKRRLALIGLGGIGLLTAYLMRPYNPLDSFIFAGAMALLSAKAWGKAQKSLALTITASLAFLAFLLPGFLTSAYHSDESVANSSGAYTVLGVTLGTNWLDASNTLREENPEASEGELRDLAIGAALDAFAENPATTFGMLFSNLARGALLLLDQAGGGLPQGNCFSGDVNWALLGCAVLNPWLWATVAFALISVASLFSLLRQKNPVSVAFLAAVISYLMMAPIASADGGWRIVSTLYPALAMGIALFPGWLYLRKPVSVAAFPVTHETDARRSSVRFLASFTTLILAIPLVAFPYPYLRNGVSVDRTTFPVVLRISDVKEGRWVDSNTAETNLSTFLDWAETTHNPLAMQFVLRNSQAFESVSLESGKIVLWFDGAHELSGEDLVEPVFLVRSS